MFLEDIGSAAAAANALDHLLIPVMNGLALAGGRENARSFVVSQSKTRTIETAQSLIESSLIG